MADRVVRVRLSAAVNEYISAMTEAANKTRAVGTEAERLAQKKQAFQTLGAGMVVVGGAMTALTLAVAKTGIEYNSLQQKSRAALTTLLGSAEAANAQMDKLDDFARNSPFSKATFITAQQQMLAFGIEAQKVVPYLDAIQNAVAAAGGSNADIEGLVSIFSKIQSSAKITATDLMQFGNRGVDAASVIGASMGKTAGEIRSEITDGSLDAGAALDALAEGMQTKFGGAAANVKETFEGAMDRVQAAWRDVSADLMKPLVDPNGGGALVDFLNWTADVMRRFQELPEPVKLASGALFGMTGAVALTGGTAMLAVPKIAQYRDALATMGTGAQRAGRFISAAGKTTAAVVGFMALTVAASKTAEALGAASDGAKGYQETLKLLLDQDVDSAFEDMSSEVQDLDEALELLLGGSFNSNMERFGSTLNGIFAGGSLADQVSETREQFSLFGQALAEMVSRGESERAAELFDQIADAAKKQGFEVKDVKDLMPEYQEALDGVTNQSKLTESATDDASDAIDGMGTSAEDAEDMLDGLRDALENVGRTAMDMSEAQDQAQSSINSMIEAAEAESVTLDGTNDASIRLRDSLREVEDRHRASAESMIDNGLSADEATAAYQRGREAILDQIQPFFESRDAAAAWADANLGSAASVEQGLHDVATAVNSIPKNPHITIGLSGAAVAISAIQEVNRQLNAIDGYKGITVGVGGGVSGLAAGGPVIGPGAKGKDSELRMLAPGEHVLTANEVDAAGGHEAIMAMRAAMLSGQPAAANTFARTPEDGKNEVFIRTRSSSRWALDALKGSI